jgi:hypothetical protein
LADELKLPEWRGQFGVGVVPVQGAVKIVRVETFEVGKVKATKMKACAIELSRLQTGGLDVRGLVGLNFLKSFQVNLNFKKRILRLDKN